MKLCQTCNSSELYYFNAHSKDLSSVSSINGIYNHDGYFPTVDNICSGDDLDITVCLNCGQIQGTFPVKIDKSNKRKKYCEAVEEAIKIEQEINKAETAARKSKTSLSNVNRFALQEKHFNTNLVSNITTLEEMLDPKFMQFIKDNNIKYTLDQNIGTYGSIVTDDDGFITLLTY